MDFNSTSILFLNRPDESISIRRALNVGALKSVTEIN